MLVAKHSWILNDKDPENPTDVTVAALLYKEIMRLTTLDTRATNKALQDNLKALLEYCVQVRGDVDKVNSYFIQNLINSCQEVREQMTRKTSCLLPISTFQMVNSENIRVRKGMIIITTSTICPMRISK